MRIFISSIIIFFLAVSCNSEKQAAVGARTKIALTSAGSGTSGAAQGPGTISLDMIPKNAARGSFLTLSPTGFSLAGAIIEWSVNGEIVQNASGPQFLAADVKKGDTVRARVNIGNVVLSPQATIINSPPVISRIEMVPDEFEGRSSLRVEASGQDADGDQVTFQYAWKKNEEPAGTGSRIEGTLKRGDFVTLSIAPFDGTDSGAAVDVRREIANQRPVITAHKEFTYRDGIYRYQVQASDADGDALTYSLEQAESGMSIDPVSGLITWQVPAEFQSTKRVTFSVSDGNEGTAQSSIDIVMR